MTNTTSPGLEQWQSQTEPSRPAVSAERFAKRRRTDGHDHASQELGLMRQSRTSGLPRFIGSGSGIHFIRTVYGVLARTAVGIRADDGNQVQGDLVPGEDDELVEPAPECVDTPSTKSRAPFWQPHEVVEDSSHGSSVVTFDSLVQCTRSYFENWHPAFPLLHGPEVLEIFERVASVGISNIGEADATIVRAIISISLADCRQSGTLQAAIPTSLLFLNQEHVASNMVFALGCPASFKSIQAAASVELFLVSMLKFNMASRLGGIIVRMSFHLGLYRCPARYPNFNDHEAAMRKRVWWSIYCLERIVCQSLGHPLGIVDDDSDVCLPLQESHRDPSTTSISEGQLAANPLLLFNLLSEHACLRGLILELRHKSIAKRHDTVERAMLVQSELAKWANEVQEMADDQVNFDDENLSQTAHSILPWQKSLLSIMHHESIITLNRPLLAAAGKSAAAQAALQACIGSSRALIDTVVMDDSRGSGDSFQSFMVWPLLTWSVWMSCFILTYAALEGETSIPSALKYAKKSLTILDNLSKRETTWPESCARGVQYLVTALQKRQDEGRSLQTNPLTPSGEPRDRERRRAEVGVNIGSHTPARQQDGRARERLPASGSLTAEPHLRLSSYNAASFSGGDVVNDAQSAQPLDPSHSLFNEAHLHTPDIFSDLDFSQEWFDPLGALDFSNFAQVGSTDSTNGFRLF